MHVREAEQSVQDSIHKAVMLVFAYTRIVD